MTSGKKVLLHWNTGSGAVNLIMLFEEGKGMYDLAKKLAMANQACSKK